VISGESVGKLLIAGIVPGLLTVLAYAIYILLRARLNPKLVGRQSYVRSVATQVVPVAAGGTGPASTARVQDEPAFTPNGPVPGEPVKSAGNAMLDTAPILVLFLVVVGGVYGGWFTPTEAGAVGALVALVFMALHARRHRIKFLPKLADSLAETASLTSMIFALIVGASVFSYFLVAAGAPAALTKWMTSLPVPPPVIVILLLLALVPLGMFLEGSAMLLISVPLAYPVITSLGYDGIWYGILVIKLIEVGLMTPPVGLNVFVLRGIAPSLSLTDAFKAVLAFLPVEIAVITVLFLFPDLVTWLPSLMK
jgi:tripartite ATP-independent transporter DctM subunit